MYQEKYIISSCTISSNVILKNDQEIFSVKADKIQEFFLAVYHFLKIDYPKFYKMDNLSKLGFLASEILLKDENLNEFEPANVGIVLTNANASLDADIKYFESLKDFASPALFVYTLPNIVTGEICIRNNFKGENSFFISEEFNAAFLEQYVTDLFKQNVVKICICGWVDVLDEEYKATLFLISENKHSKALLFSKGNMDTIFKSGERK
ncbi:MAG: hypothetical protein ABJA35_08385 [Parafilimonas sp.]